MYIKKEDARRLIKEFDKEIIKDYTEFIETLCELLKEGDWTFVVKSHSFIEKISSDLLAAKCEASEFEDTIKHLPLHGGKLSKTYLLKKYGIINNESESFLRKFSEIRNDIVHSFDNTNFNFIDYVESLDKNQRKNWIKSVTFFYENEDNKQLWAKNIDKLSKYAVFMTLMMLMSEFTAQYNIAKTNHKLDKVCEETTKELLKSRINER